MQAEVVLKICEITTQGLASEKLPRENEGYKYMISLIVINCPLADGLPQGKRIAAPRTGIELGE